MKKRVIRVVYASLWGFETLVVFLLFWQGVMEGILHHMAFQDILSAAYGTFRSAINGILPAIAVFIERYIAWGRKQKKLTAEGKC